MIGCAVHATSTISPAVIPATSAASHGRLRRGTPSRCISSKKEEEEVRRRCRRREDRLASRTGRSSRRRRTWETGSAPSAMLIISLCGTLASSVELVAMGRQSRRSRRGLSIKHGIKAANSSWAVGSSSDGGLMVCTATLLISSHIYSALRTAEYLAYLRALSSYILFIFRCYAAFGEAAVGFRS